ncbi:transcriptional regulator [Streptomyces kunmingensis]|uniref:Transcriptional regulator n=1 Tax=Streptomyces kunmingensis TaxID=68225 RepID=A0ABU6CHZ9_9ACTN|nr:transcriptional regulator [Streptomyces kunmingensis]MEB3963831.1 transcriptional regulator [Streptomyces kunmingensis]
MSVIPASVSPMLGRLADERATGALIREHGTLYLADGRIVHAESPATPGMDVLLTTGGAVQADRWWEAVDRAGARRRVGRYLVEQGRLSDGALELCHLGAVFDAAYFTLAPSSGPTRFRYGVSHWFGAVRPVPVAAVERETRRRRELLQRIWPEPDTDTAPLARATGLELPVPARRRRVLELVDGARTASEIALTLGRPAFHTLVDLRRLAAGGLVTPALPEPATTPAVPEWMAHAAVEDPDVALLRRLRAALEAL